MSARTLWDRANSDDYMTYHGDGMIDIFVGIVLVLFGLGIMANLPWIGGVMAAALFPVWLSAKRTITAPRAAYLERLPSQAVRTRWAMLVSVGLGLLVLLGLLAFWLFGANAAPIDLQTAVRDYFTLVFGAVAVVTFGAIGLVGGIGRYYLYAGFAVLTFVISQAGSAAFYWPLIATGSVLVLGGLWLVYRFVQVYPAVDE